MLSDEIILLHDNTNPHTANLVRDKLHRFGWETLQHPQYNPNLFPCDFHIFGDLKKDIHERIGLEIDLLSFIPLISNNDNIFTSISTGRGSPRVGKVVHPPVTYIFLKKLELIISSPSGINVSTLQAITFE